jgi:tRNA threonylcarbamoyladenosine biosynthesis protein TsaE
MVVDSFTAQETYSLGKSVGWKAKRGQVFCLNGDLGVGKTVFTQGFAAGLDITEPICSPTFTIVQVYEEGRLPLYHFDVYRIVDSSEMEEIGYEDYFFGNGVCLIEWSNLIRNLLPEKVTTISIEKDLTRGFDYRRIIIDEEGKTAAMQWD